MEILDRERPLAERLAANHPGILEAYENYLGADLGEIYCLDLEFWLYQEYPHIRADTTLSDIERARDRCTEKLFSDEEN